MQGSRFGPKEWPQLFSRLQHHGGNLGYISSAQKRTCPPRLASETAQLNLGTRCQSLECSQPGWYYGAPRRREESLACLAYIVFVDLLSDTRRLSLENEGKTYIFG